MSIGSLPESLSQAMLVWIMLVGRLGVRSPSGRFERRARGGAEHLCGSPQPTTRRPVHAHVHRSMHTCMHTLIHSFIHTLLHPYINTFVQPNSHTSARACAHAHMRTPVLPVVPTPLPKTLDPAAPQGFLGGLT